MKKTTIWISAAALICAGGYLGWRQYKKKQGQKEAKVEDAVKVSRGKLELKFADLGELAPKDVIDINSKASGRVIELFAEEGQAVNKGDKLVTVQAGKSESERYVPTTITAATDGRIMRCASNDSGKDPRFTRVGDMVSGTYDSGNPTCIMQLANMDKLVVKMQVNELDVLKLRHGMPVSVSFDTLPGVAIPGRIGLIPPQAENNRQNIKIFRVRIDLDTANKALRMGMTARVEAVLETRKDALKMPLSALFEDNGGLFVYKYMGKNEKPRKMPVKIGLRTETDVEILSGPADGDLLMTDKPYEVQ